MEMLIIFSTLILSVLVIHSNGVITGSFMNSGAVRCGDLICRPITGLFSKNPLPSGFVHVATIPAGSSNISITELKNSMNLLALSYSDDDRPIINGDYSVSLSGIYEAAGATFDYQRIDGVTNTSSPSYRKMEGVTEWITCTGRIAEPIQLKVLAKEKNPGIKYEYLLPINGNFDSNSDEANYDYTSAETEQPLLTTVSASALRHTLKSGTVTINPMNVTRERKRRKFMWKVVDFHPCNKSCGGGIQIPIYHCVKEGPSKRFVPKRCAHLSKPILSDSVLKCNTQPCPAYWKIAEWSSCQCTGIDDTGFQKREIKCVQELGTGMVIQIPNGACLEEKPDGKQLCECTKNKHDTYKYRVSQHGLNSIKHRLHHSKIAILNDDNTNTLTNRPDVIQKNKKSGVWLTSEWTEQCTTECGDGVQYRSIFCDRSVPNIDRCDIRFTPDTTKQCTRNDKCDIGDWFISAWSPCSGDCFNLTQTRTIYCIKNAIILDDVNCESNLKPVGIQKCNISQVPDCGPSWHYSEWSECSRQCGGGTQRRSIKCLSFEPNEDEMKESDNCKHKKRKRASQQIPLSYSDDDRPIINGDYSVSLSGIYEAAGATFDYQRIDGVTNTSSPSYRKMEGVTEWITCTGRIAEPIQLKVLAKEKNPGIKYEYLLPINGNFDSNSDEANYDYTSAETEQPLLTTVSASALRHTLKSGTVTINPMNVTRERKRRKFMWKVVDFHPCNKSCGGGIQIPIYHCVKEGPSKRFVPKRCAHLSKPILSDSVLKCNTQPCPAYWKIAEWSSCQCTGIDDTGFQKREIKCVQELGTGMVIQIPNGACLEEKPDGKQLCECTKNKHDTYKYRVSQHGLNSIKHRLHHSKIAILNDDNTNTLTNRPDVIQKNKKSGVWLTSEWTEQCTTECGDGVQYRSIFCDRSVPNIDRCDIRFTPDTTKQCTRNDKCDIGDWFISAWSPCSGDCFNLTQTRTIYCIKNAIILDDVNCESNLKPVGIQKCNISQVPDCGPSWHYSEWSECSRQCGGGTQRRSIKCLSFEPNEDEMKESDNCKHKKRKRASQTCNMHSCDATTEQTPDPRVDLIQNDIAPDCKDELPNCSFAVKQQLCKWPYIKEQCCETCLSKS